LIIAQAGARAGWCLRWSVVLLASSLLLLAAFVLAIAVADPLLVVRTAVAPADVIVVLGGDGPRRADRAAALFQAGLAPRFLISGDGDCDDIRRLLIGAGVPSNAITIECASGSTIENASFSAPILAAMGARSSLLVTSWFHTRRAVASFRKAMPGIHWMSTPVERSESLWHLLWQVDGVQIAKEYGKVAWYELRYGVPLSMESGRTREAKP
jgi:uncharacterized SAM-binding protein YcdF (DUF218 family)